MSKKTKPQIRKCVITNERRQKCELLRVVRVAGGVIIDPTSKRHGRGAYITPDVEIVKKAKKKNAFARALRTKIEVQIYDDLLQMVMEGQIYE